ncbi:ankyrin repeat domain-containing protein, partial [Aspergillus ruber CBS 135680]
LDDELLFICESDQPDTLENVIQQRALITPDYIPPLSTIMAAAVYHDSSAIVANCLSKKTKVVDPIMTFIAQRGAWKSYKLIIEAGAIDINYVIPWYGDILSTVATNNDLKMAQFCLEHGADPNRNRVDEYKTVIAATAELGYVDMVALLLEYGAVLKGSGAIVLAAEEGEIEMVRFLLERGADVDEVGVEDPLDERTKEDVGSAMHHAIENSHGEVA